MGVRSSSGTDGLVDTKLIYGTSIAGMNHRTKKDDKVSCSLNTYMCICAVLMFDEVR